MNKLILILRLSIIFLAININSQEIFVEYSQKIPGTDFLIEMAAIPGGEFKMGSPMNEKNRLADEGPQRKVVVDSFWMAKHETTWNLFQLYMDREIDKNQIRNVNNEIDIDVDGVSSATTPYVEMSFGMGTDGYPAISMTQLSASKFCEWLSAMTGNYYRLPTEAEWEYACRAGSSGPYHFDENLETLDDYAWYSKNSDGKYQKVGTKKPNNFGLFDMHGNVSEWTLDQYDPRAYSNQTDSILYNPYNYAKKLYPRVVKGGSFMNPDYRVRSATRYSSNKQWKKQDPQIPRSRWWHTDAQFLGFRIVRPLETPNEDDKKKYWIN